MSKMSMRRPCAVSCMTTTRRSPEFMKRACWGLGVKVAVVALTGFAGAWATPFFVMNAKLTGSIPTVPKQAALLLCPVTGFCERLSMLSAAHHLVAPQLLFTGNGTQPGG